MSIEGNCYKYLMAILEGVLLVFIACSSKILVLQADTISVTFVVPHNKFL